MLGNSVNLKVPFKLSVVAPPRPIEKYITDSENGINWIKIGDAPSMGNYITKTSEKIKPEGLTKTREVHPGDLILSNSMSFGRPYIMAINGCIHDGWLLLRNDKNLYDLQFLCHLLGSDNMKSLAAGSTVNNLNKDLVGSTTVSFPPKKEQSKLGAFFNDIDTLITLHQDKIEAIKKYKAGMLQKMFPREGETVPEIRFPGFTEEWEKRKLNEVVSYMSSNLSARDVEENGNFDLYDANGVIGKTNKIPCNETYITIIKDGAGVGKTRILQAKTCFIGTMGAIFAKDRNDICFIFQVLNQFDFSSYVTGSTIPHIYFKDYGNQQIRIPNFPEQQKIAIFFQALDKLISFHLREYDKLKELKKGLLQQMFV